MYNFSVIEKKWQKKWLDEECFNVKVDPSKEKFYMLVEFPYPSGVGLHVGHARVYTASDVQARYRRALGYNVLFPMGWDAFGAPAEQYAIQNHIHPKEAVNENIKVFKGQMQSLGLAIDWSREFSTTDPEYYRLTQWQFLQFYKAGLAYKAEKEINWCPKCKTGLSNEDAQGGVCERCGSKTTKKLKNQWVLRMSDYADKLLDGLNDTEFLDKVKTAQINWIGKSTGASINFKLKDTDDYLEVFTTRADTLYGVTFMVVSPEHPYLEKYKERIHNLKELRAYQEEARRKSDIERTDATREKTGICLDGLTAINPINNEEIPIWVSDYVLAGYGTGAIMAVPAHDERDYAFAKKFNIPIRQVIIPVYEGDDKPIPGKEETKREVVVLIVKHPTENKYLCVKNLKLGWKSLLMGGIEDGETPEEAAKRELREESGYTNYVYDWTFDFMFREKFYAEHKDVNRNITSHVIVGHLTTLTQGSIAEEEKNTQEAFWVDADELIDTLDFTTHKNVITDYFNGENAYIGDGEMVNSDILNDIDNKKDSIDKMINYLESHGIGKKTTNYRLQDWIFSRQRFWGEPIPMINCPKCGWVPVPEEDLPVVLPDVSAYEPTETGESPLANIKEWVNTTCPVCGSKAERETDTMPNWAGSSWYWLRYMDPHSDKIASEEALNYWGKVDLYDGGMEHATRHLLYARFWNIFLHEQGLVPNSEPFLKRISHGMILGEGGEKMSKSKGNVVNPNDMIRDYGADALRTYEMFIGDYSKDAAWSENGLKGCKKFLDRVWKLQTKLNDQEGYSKELEGMIHKTIKKVTTDIKNLDYNTAVSALMILLNETDKVKTITKADYRTFIQLLNPFAPHMTEELNEVCALGEPLYNSSWPTYDESKTIEESYEMVVQVNGKVRGKITVSTSATEDEMKALAKEIDNVKSHLDGKTIVKEIVVPQKLVNIVVK